MAPPLAGAELSWPGALPCQCPPGNSDQLFLFVTHYLSQALEKCSWLLSGWGSLVALRHCQHCEQSLHLHADSSGPGSIQGLLLCCLALVLTVMGFSPPWTLYLNPWPPLSEWLVVMGICSPGPWVSHSSGYWLQATMDRREVEGE